VDQRLEWGMGRRRPAGTEGPLSAREPTMPLTHGLAPERRKQPFSSLDQATAVTEPEPNFYRPALEPAPVALGFDRGVPSSLRLRGPATTEKSRT
jgi:hypothetical protein